MTVTLDSVCSAITSLDNSAFDLSDDVEQLAKHPEAHTQILQALAERVKSDPSFRDDIDDFGILQAIMDHLGEEVAFVHLLLEICGHHRGLRQVVGSSLMVKVGVFQSLTESPATSGNSKADLYGFANHLCKGIVSNKKIFLSLIPSLIRSHAAIPVNPDPTSLSFLCTLLRDDDRDFRSDPCLVMARNQALEDGGFELLRTVLKAASVKDELQSYALILLNEISCSQAHSKTLAVEDGHLGWVKESITEYQGTGNIRMIVDCMKLLRAWSFSDELKDEIMSTVYETSGRLIAASHSDSVVCSCFFAILANISLRKPETASNILKDINGLDIIIDRVTRQGATHDGFQSCLQYVRTLARSIHGLEALKYFGDRFCFLSEDRSLTDAQRRLASEIASKLRSDYSQTAQGPTEEN
jgi:hypothetical protein